MINKNEIIFAVDENNNPIEPVERKKAHTEGVWHRTTDVIVMNSRSEIICHKRSMLKDTGPGLWDPTFGGHILAGVVSVVSAKEELFEESGIEAEIKDFDFFTISKYISADGQNKEFRYAYVYRWDGDINDLRLEKDEIDEAKWINLEEIKKNRDNRAVWVPMPYLDELLKKLNR